MARVLIVDDDDGFRASLAETLIALGHEVLEAAGAVAGLECLRRERVDLVFLDYRLSDLDGLAALRQMKAQLPELTAPVVMLTAYASADNTIEAMKLGAFDHLAKPLGRDQICAVLDRALRHNARHAARLPGPADEELRDTLIGASPLMREAQKLIGLAAAGDATVLINGETGTGKELAARLLHRASDRAEGPFVAVNCAAIPSELLESELFGHLRGAYTGATGTRRGSFRMADGGTLFLDEIGDMSLAMQPKILRALQEREIVPLGADRPLRVDVRVVAATHRDLAQLATQGRFRQDLYFRLNVVPIQLPPLRERLEDIRPLAERFLRIAQSQAPKRLTEAAVARLMAHAWPGNVRELRNAMERVSVTVRGAAVEPEDLDFLPTGTAGGVEALPAELLALPLPQAIAELESALIRRALTAAGGNRAEAARHLGIHRQLLYSKLKQYGFE
jgi:DNA-binding NtrC family response regulator